MKHIQKAFGGNSPRLVAVGPDTPELQEQLQQASKASDSLSVIFATEADKVRLRRGVEGRVGGVGCGAAAADRAPLRLLAGLAGREGCPTGGGIAGRTSDTPLLSPPTHPRSAWWTTTASSPRAPRCC